MEGTSKRARVLLSFDAEEFDIPREFGFSISDAETLRVGAEGIARTLDLLDEVGVRATFFTTARIAQHAPELIVRAAKAGHEIASHGFDHSRFEDADLARSRDALLEILRSAGVEERLVRVEGFRRPRMAPTDARAVRGAGYVYHSSENPIWLPGRYNKFFSPRRWSVEATAAGELMKIPAAATPMVRWPLFWLSFKNVPLAWTKLMTGWCLSSDGYAALYFHPWELCELSGAGGFGLPKHVRRLDGQRLTDRLRRYLLWLKARTEIETYGGFVERAMKGRAAGA